MSESHTTPSTGRLEGKTHVLPVRVYYEDTDFSGVVYHASYLRFLERGRTEFLRLAGIGHAELWTLQNPLAFTLRRIAVEFLNPARVDDALEVHTVFGSFEGASLHATQSLQRGGETLLTAAVHVVLIGVGGKPRKPPAFLRAALKTLVTSGAATTS